MLPEALRTPTVYTTGLLERTAPGIVMVGVVAAAPEASADCRTAEAPNLAIPATRKTPIAMFCSGDTLPQACPDTETVIDPVVTAKSLTHV